MTENVIWQPNKVSAKDRYRVLGQKGLLFGLRDFPVPENQQLR